MASRSACVRARASALPAYPAVPRASTAASDQAAEWARRFAGRVVEVAGPDTRRQTEAAYALAFSRKPDPWEIDTAQTFMARQADANAKAAALADFCLMLLNSNEFVYQF